ncbi:hypothetical protein [Coleofasciculus sp. E1-EBD-02]|uniref:hypothetical protein n=1 Tax=Coleofasciculus sp. E1-EBD-02 TaxID=3068481 RepID=UPI0032FECFC0
MPRFTQNSGQITPLDIPPCLYLSTANRSLWLIGCPVPTDPLRMIDDPTNPPVVTVTTGVIKHRSGR